MTARSAQIAERDDARLLDWRVHDLRETGKISLVGGPGNRSPGRRPGASDRARQMQISQLFSADACGNAVVVARGAWTFECRPWQTNILFDVRHDHPFSRGTTSARAP